jgi:hypothetical protein
MRASRAIWTRRENPPEGWEGWFVVHNSHPHGWYTFATLLVSER